MCGVDGNSFLGTLFEAARKMATKVWIMRSMVVVQLVSALRMLPQHKQLSINSRAPAQMKVINSIVNTEPTVSDKRRANFIEKMLLESVNQDRPSAMKAKVMEERAMKARAMKERAMKVRAMKARGMNASRLNIKTGNRPALRQEAVAVASAQKTAKEEVEEKELTKVARSPALSELLGKPYVETRGKNDYLVIQSNSVDPFVTVIPNSIYYSIEKKCVNWLDACSLKGIRNHLLQRIQPYK